MKKERLFYLDFVRAVAVISIVLTHFNARYLYLNPPAPEKAVLTTNIGNLYIGDWGVSLFFIISGAALMYVYGDRCDLKKFYKKRMLSIYPMFWIAYAADFLFILWKTHALPGNGIPKWRIIFSILGFDGLLLTNGFPTFYLLGEWFLGVIILIYLIFPLLRKLMNERPVLLAGFVLGGYLLGFAICRVASWPLVPATMLLIRIPELVFGMFFVSVHTGKISLDFLGIKEDGSITWKTALVSLAIVVLNWVLKPGISSSIQTTYVGIASFLVLVYLSGVLKCPAIESVCGILSKYSYAVFLVHHIVIANIMERINLMEISVGKSYLLFGGTCIVIAVFTLGLFWVHHFVMKIIMHVKSKD